MSHIPVHARFDPFEAITTSYQVEQGRTITEIVSAAPNVPDWFWISGTVRINGHVIPRELWTRVRPKCSVIQRPIVVTIHGAVLSGGGGSTKNIVTTVAAIALIAGATLVSGGVLGPAAAGGIGTGLLGPAFAAGGIGANLAAAGLGIAATLLLSTLAPPPVAPPDTGRGPQQ